jgi:para-aminobenzoate synthetase component I
MRRMHPEPVQIPLSPEQVFRRWPRESPVAALLSCGGNGPGMGASPRSRWSILACPTETISCSRDEPRMLEWLRARLARQRTGREGCGELPFCSGWIGSLSYGLGAAIEPAARARGSGSARDGAEPLYELHRCEGAYVHDAGTGRWWAAGDTRDLPPIDSLLGCRATEQVARVGTLTSDTGRELFEEQVRRIIELIRAGDVFQVNLAHRLRAGFEGDARSLFSHLARRAQPWYGAYLESVRGCTLSMSPELFFEFDPATRLVTTRPMKGTRAGAADPAELLASAKDAAELHMIIDLMRNDLGRVCEYGSIRVDQARAVEAHGDSARPRGGVLQTVATVSGRLRRGLDAFDVLAGTFPPGSVTGAPKVRAMQIIDELEPVPRGVYCGAIGYIADSGRASFNVAIRTARIDWDRAGAESAPQRGRATLCYSVGAGIVADSDPGAEWRETMLKAGPLLDQPESRGPEELGAHNICIPAREPQTTHA